MTIEHLRKVIHEEVVKAMREELREILTEAVSGPKDSLQESLNISKVGEKRTQRQPSSISDLLKETADKMKSEDFRDLLPSGEVKQQFSVVPNFLSEAIMKAGAVFNKSKEKDKERYGL